MRTNVGPESVFITLLAIKLGLGRLRNLFLLFGHVVDAKYSNERKLNVEGLFAVKIMQISTLHLETKLEIY